MKHTKTTLRAIKIFNSYDIAKEGEKPRLFISYSAGTSGLASRSPHWSVVGIGHQTNPSAHWMDQGCKVFTVYGRVDKEPKLKEAMDFCKEKYGITEWEKDPFGDYQKKGTTARAVLAHEPKITPVDHQYPAQGFIS